MTHTPNLAELPVRGDFAGKALVGPFAPSAAAMDSSAPLYGMPPEALYLWGTLRDDHGDLHTIMRRIPHDGEPRSRKRLVLQSTVGGADALRIHPCGRVTAAHVEPIRELLPPDAIEWRSNPDRGGSALSGSLEQQVVRVGRGGHVRPAGNPRWAGDAVVRARCSREHGLRCHDLPASRDDLGSSLPRIHWLRSGPHVRGRGGLPNPRSADRGRLRTPLVTWATRFTDGSLEAGHFMLGNDRFGFGIVTDENEQVRCTTDVDGEVTFDESGYWQTSARFALASVEYEFFPCRRKGRMLDLGPIPNPQVEGRWQRVDETANLQCGSPGERPFLATERPRVTTP